MMNVAALTVKQADMVKGLRTFYKGKNAITRKEIIVYLQTLTPETPVLYAPDFLVKNEAFKIKDKDGNVLRGKYRLPAAQASAESKAKEKAKAAKAVAKTAKSTQKGSSGTGGTPAEGTATVKRIAKSAGKLSQSAKDRKAALETSAEAIANLNNEPAEQTMAVGATEPTE